MGIAFWWCLCPYVPAIVAVSEISTLDSSAELTDVINNVNEILQAVKRSL